VEQMMQGQRSHDLHRGSLGVRLQDGLDDGCLHPFAATSEEEWQVAHSVLHFSRPREQIEQFAGDGSGFGLRIEYSRETDGLLGTGGALRKALPLLGEQFFLLYGDSWLEINYTLVAEAFVKSGLPALMTVYRNEGKWDTSNVEVGESQILLYSKTERNERMHHIDYGLGILTREVFKDRLQGQAFGLAEIYERLSRKKQLASFEATNRFHEIGSKEGLQEFEKYYVKK